MLKAETERVWRVLESRPGLGDFVLVGGTALTLHLRHRVSEDLDIAFPEARLPRLRLDGLRRGLEDAGVAMVPNDDPTAVAEFASGGLDLLDYQQDYLAGGRVRVSLFSPEAPERAVLDRSGDPAGTLRVASLAELFRLKSLVSARRSRLRDWIDLHALMTRCGFDLGHYRAAFERAGIPQQIAAGLGRLCSGTPHVADEGVEALAPGMPSVRELQAFFTEARDRFERSEAARARRQRQGS